MTAERKAEQTAWLAEAGTPGDVECRECGKRASNYRHYAHPSGHDCLSGCPEGLHHTFYPLPTESEPEREKCHKFYCPNQPAWIPAGQNGCPHCGGTATRGFCICEMASADEIRDMYTPPAPESEPERCKCCGMVGPSAACQARHENGDCEVCQSPSPAPETPSPEVGMREEAHRLLDAWLDSDGTMAWNTVQRAACDARDAILAAAKEQSK